MATGERTMLKMIAELHVRGYQRLRIVPHIGSVGAWRCGITPAANIRADHGATPVDWSWERVPQYTQAAGKDYFEWGDSSHLTASRLADRFIQRFPAVAREGYGPDWLYAGWYVELLQRTYPDRLPIAFADYTDTTHFFVTSDPDVTIPLPPPGMAAADPR
jgi:hypothetical protein